MLQHFDLKVYLFTGIALLVSLQNYETMLRFILLILSILYTVYKIIDRFKEQADKKRDDEKLSK